MGGVRGVLVHGRISERLSEMWLRTKGWSRLHSDSQTMLAYCHLALGKALERALHSIPA